jgi:histidinol-phosphate aminotransferase
MNTRSVPSVPGIRPVIKEVTPYQPGKFIEDVQDELGLSEVIKIASNENPYGPYPKSIEKMKLELVRLNQYPDSSFKELRRTLGRVHGVSPECICISHGAEGMLQTIGRCFIQEGDEVIIPAATYTLYREISKVMGARVIDASMTAEGVDLSAIKERIGPKTKLIWLANPNNPTGTIVDKDAFGRLLDALPERAWVVLDEAYAEFADATRLPERVKLILQGRHLISVRSFSKAYGLAGARLGYALAGKEIVTVINTVSEPFNANRVAIAGALAAINEDADSFREAVSRIIRDRALTADRLRRMGLKVIPSQANFLMFETPIDAQQVFEALLKTGVIVRPCNAWGYDHMIRVTIGTSAQMDTFIEALSGVLRSPEFRTSKG